MEKMNRTMGPWQAASIVVGTIIGTGIFMKTTIMVQLLGSYQLVFWAWVIAGILSYAGALTYAELASHYPESGGEYVILRESFGHATSFLYGWIRFWVASPGTIAAFGVGSATFLSAILPLDFFPFKSQGVALFFIFIFSAFNCLKVQWGARIQTFLTALKIILIIGLFTGIMLFGRPITQNLLSSNSPLLNLPTWNDPIAFLKTFMLAIVAALWAFDGWNTLPMAAGEIRNPKKNIPIALGLGVFIVGLLYILVNHAYFQVLSLQQIITSNSENYPTALPVATLAAQSFLGKFGIPILSGAFVISALGAMNGAILTSARIPYAMAKDGLFWKKLAEIKSESHTPVAAIVAQAIISAVLALTGSFDQLTDYVVVSSWVFYGLTTVSIFKLRNKKSYESNSNSIYRVPFYPALPILFILAAIGLTLNSIIVQPKNALAGFIIILVGYPVYLYFKNKNK